MRAAAVGRQRHALAEQALVALEREVGAGAARRSLPTRVEDLGDVSVDVMPAQRARDRDAVVAVAHEVHVADAGRAEIGGIDSPRRIACAILSQRQRTRPVVGPEAAVEVAACGRRCRRSSRAGSTCRPERALARAAEGRDDLLEGQDDVEVAVLAAQAAGYAGERPLAPGAQEVALGVGGREARVARHPPGIARAARRIVARGSRPAARASRGGRFAARFATPRSG